MSIEIAQRPTTAEPCLTDMLKNYTDSDHESLDQRIMRAQPFESEANYKAFLKMQYCFHWLTEPLFKQESLAFWVPSIISGCRLEALHQDCADLGLAEAKLAALVADLEPLRVTDEAAIGWLYTIEGSNLGASILFKMVRKIGFDQNHGASHLAGHSEGRGKHWQNIKAEMNALVFSKQQQTEVCQGAEQAFKFVRQQVEKLLPAVI